VPSHVNGRLADGGGGRGECPTPRKREGELSGSGKCPGEYVAGDLSKGKCTDPIATGFAREKNASIRTSIRTKAVVLISK